MLERWCGQLVALGKRRPKLRWPLAALLALLYAAAALWEGVTAFRQWLAPKARRLAAELAAVGREAMEHLKETGQSAAEQSRRLIRLCRDRLWPLARARGRAVFHTARQWCSDGIRAAKTDAPIHGARLKGAALGVARSTGNQARRAADVFRADLPALRRYAPRRAMAMALTLCMAMTMLPVGAFAAEESACPHDLGRHDETCGYVEAVDGSPCAHTEHDKSCGYAEAVGEVPCDKECVDADGDGVIDHAPDCAYTPTIEGQPCKHEQGEHDETCGFAEAVEEKPCLHEHDADCGGLVSPPPTETECTCGAQPGEDGVTTHTEGCPLYTAPVEPAPPATPESTPTAAPAVELTAIRKVEPQEAFEGMLTELSLPETLTGIYEGGTVAVAVVWSGMPDPPVKGAYTLTAQLTPPEGYVLSPNVDTPTMQVTFTPDPAVEAVREGLTNLPTPEAVAAESDDTRLTQWREQCKTLRDAYTALSELEKTLAPAGTAATLDALEAALQGKAPVSRPHTPDTAWYTGEGPYTLTTAEELAGLARLVNDGTDDFEDKILYLGDDVALNDVSGGTESWAATPPQYIWTPIGMGMGGDALFRGVFDGQGHTISGLYANGSQAGLFGCLGGAVRNLTLADGYVTGGAGACCAALAAVIGGDAAIRDCHTSVTVAGGGDSSLSYAGGLVAYMPQPAKEAAYPLVLGSVTVGGVKLDRDRNDYTFDPATGALAIPAAKMTGDVEVKATASTTEAFWGSAPNYRYGSLDEAWAAVRDSGGTITLRKDVTTANHYEVTADVTIKGAYELTYQPESTESIQPMFTVKGGGTLRLSKIYLVGNAPSTVDTLLQVEDGGVLRAEEGAALDRNGTDRTTPIITNAGNVYLGKCTISDGPAVENAVGGRLFLFSTGETAGPALEAGLILREENSVIANSGGETPQYHLRILPSDAAVLPIEWRGELKAGQTLVIGLKDGVVAAQLRLTDPTGDWKLAYQDLDGDPATTADNVLRVGSAVSAPSVAVAGATVSMAVGQIPTMPKVTIDVHESVPVTAEGWQFSADGETDWAAFAPGPDAIHYAMDGGFLRYFAANEKGTGYSAKLAVSVTQAAYDPGVQGEITWPTPAAVVYGQTLAGAALAGGAGPGTFDWADATVKPEVGKTYPARFTPTDTDYAPVTRAIAVTVTPKEVTITKFAMEDRAYDGTQTVARGYGGSLSGAENDDTLWLEYGDATYTVETPDVGEEKPVTVTGVKLGGYRAACYTLLMPTYVTVTITPRTYSEGDTQGVKIAPIPDQAYTGVAAEPDVAMTIGGATLRKDADYTLSWANNTEKRGQDEENPPTVTITFGGTSGNLKGTASARFSIIDSPLPEGTPLESVVDASRDELMEWHKADVVLTARPGWTLSADGASYGDTVTLSAESTLGEDGAPVPGAGTFRARDGAGKTYLVTVSYRLDRTVPTISAVKGVPTAWTNADTPITFTAGDALSGVGNAGVKRDGTADYAVDNGKFTANRNGSYVITLADKAGNTATKTVAVEKIDKSTPAKPTVTGYASDTWTGADIALTLSTTDTAATVPSGTKFQVKAGGADWADMGGNACAVTENTDGVTYQFRTLSGAGTPSGTESLVVKLDKTVPAVGLNVTAGGAAYDGSAFTAHDVVLTLTNTPANLSGVTYYYQKTDETDWTKLEGNALTVDENCDTVYTFKAVSGAGAESTDRPAATVRRSAMDDGELAKTAYGPGDFKLDKTPNAGGWHQAAPTVTVTKKATVGEGGLPAVTYYELYQAPGESGTRTELTGDSIRPESDGVWTLKVWTEDAAGNRTKAYVLPILADATAPTVTDLAGAPADWTRENAAITFNAADALSGVERVEVADSKGVSYAVTENKTFQADRNETYTVTVTDKAGNQAAGTVTVSKIDKTAPVVSWDAAAAALEPGKWYGKTVLTATAGDDSGETPKISLTVGSETFDSGKAVEKSGVHSIIASAVDSAGNVGSSSPLTLRVETAIDEFVDRTEALSGASGYQEVLAVKTWYDGQSQIIRDRLSKSDAANAAYWTLTEWLMGKAQEAVDGVTESIRNAGTLAAIETAAEDFEALPEEIRSQIPGAAAAALKTKAADAGAAADVVEQLANADRPSGGSCEEKQAAQAAYVRLTDSQKALVDQEPAAMENKGHIDADLSAIKGVLDSLEGVEKTDTPAAMERIEAARAAYDGLTEAQVQAFPRSDAERLASLWAMHERVRTVEAAIDALGGTPSAEELQQAKGSCDALTADERSMLDGMRRARLNRMYQAMLDGLSADQKAAAEFATKVEETRQRFTVEAIRQLVEAYGALGAGAKAGLDEQTAKAYQGLADDLSAAQAVIGQLEPIALERLNAADLGRVTAAVESCRGLSVERQTLVAEAAGGKAGVLDQAVTEAADVTEKVSAIPSHGGGSPDLDKCTGHDYEAHKTAIEAAWTACGTMSDAGRKLMDGAVTARLETEYQALIDHMGYQNTVSVGGTSVEVIGLTDQVELPPEAASAEKTTVGVAAEESKPAVMPPLPAGKTAALSLDIKLVANICNDADSAVQVQVQPRDDSQVVLKVKLPSGYQNDTLELWHVKGNGVRSRIENFRLVTEPGGVYVVFEVSSFSHFVFFAEKTPTGDGGTGGGTVTPTPKPDIPGTDHDSTSVNPQQPKPGTNVTISPKPDEGYVVDKVIVTDMNGEDIPVRDNGDGTYSYTQPKEKVTVTVTFKPAPKDTTLPFTDVSESDWFYGSVKCVYEQGLMNGTDRDKFSPYMTTSRGMIVTILWRLEGSPETAVTPPFNDVAADSYCAKAVARGAENGIVKGYGNGNFGPNDPITREQLAAILYRYTQFKGMDTPTAGDLSRFNDQPSAWAADAVRWAVDAGIISGKGGSVLDPAGAATRAETAVMLQRFIEMKTK